MELNCILATIRYLKKSPNNWKLNNTILNNSQVKEEIIEKNRKYLRLNNKNTSQNVWDIAKAVLRKKFMPLAVHIRKEEQFNFNGLNFHLMRLGKDDQLNSE